MHSTSGTCDEEEALILHETKKAFTIKNQTKNDAPYATTANFAITIKS